MGHSLQVGQDVSRAAVPMARCPLRTHLDEMKKKQRNFKIKGPDTKVVNCGNWQRFELCIATRSMANELNSSSHVCSSLQESTNTILSKNI